MDFKLVFIQSGVKVMPQLNAVLAAFGFTATVPLPGVFALPFGPLPGNVCKLQ